MDEQLRKILKIASGDLPPASRPFDEWSRRAGVDTRQFILALQSALDAGIIRRFGAVLAHTKSGMKNNAMVAWEVVDDDADRAGRIMARFDAVSHCYLRVPAPGFPYRLYTMIHARDDRELSACIDSIRQDTGLVSFVVLVSVREFKKTSPDYLNQT
jgi:DNA-binding Lrp family transcriptional regulator